MLTRGEHNNANCSTFLVRQQRDVRQMLEFLCSHEPRVLGADFFVTSLENVSTLKCPKIKALLTPTWREPFDNPFHQTHDWLRRTLDTAASLTDGSINNYFYMNSCCSTPARTPSLSILFLWTTNSCDEIEIPQGCLYQKSLTWRMMTVDLCVNSIRRHCHRKAAQTCHFHPTHFLLFILSLVHTFIEWSEDFIQEKLPNETAYWKPLRKAHIRTNRWG